MSIQINRSDVIWNIAGTALSMAANLLLLPVVIYFLDAEMLGLWYVFSSIGAITQLFDFGFSATFSRNVSYSWSGASRLTKTGVAHDIISTNPNFNLLNTIIRTCKVLYLIIATIVLVLIGTIGTPYVLHISAHIDNKSFLIAWAIYAIATFLNLYYGYYTPFLRGVGGIKYSNQNIIIARLLQIVFTILFLCLGFGLIGACTAYLIYGFTFRTLGKRRFYSYHNIGEHLRSLKEQPGKAEMLDTFKAIWYSAWRDGLVSLSNYLSSQASTIICSLFMTLALTGSYSLGLQIATAITTIASAYYSTFYPKLQSAYILREQDTINHIMSKAICVYCITFGVSVLLAVFVALPFLSYVRADSVMPADLFSIIAIAQFLLGYRNIFTTYYACTNRIIYTRSFIISSVLCIAFQLIFCGVLDLGPFGLALATILSQLLFNVWYWPVRAHIELGLTPMAVVRDAFSSIYK